MNLEPTGPPESAPDHIEHDLVILPERIDGDIGIYRDELLTFVKALRAEGVDAAFLHDSEHREWLALMGDVPTSMLIGVASSFIGSAAWYAFLKLTGAGPGSKKVRIKFGRYNQDGAEWFEGKGDADGVNRALEQFAGSKETDASEDGDD